MLLRRLAHLSGRGPTNAARLWSYCPEAETRRNSGGAPLQARMSIGGSAIFRCASCTTSS
jgi:hypothetical protein